MSDDTKHEQPSAGGRYIRQADGSLVRETVEPAGQSQDAVETPAASEAPSTKTPARSRTKKEH